ncbi:MAG: LuxR C-terminal-related transcriptional regulator [Acetatifactor sp.]|nr:LuxR C-terminal-related transcriptional regulator [Acetatifactor sp.]
MGRRLIRFLLGSLYVGLLTLLLVAHVQGIAGQIERTMASVEVLLLALPAMAVMVLYARMGEPGEEDGLTQETGQSELTSVEELKERLQDCPLTRREWEIAWLIYRGYSNREIAEEFCIAESTVKKHTSHIYEKIQVSGRKEFREKVKNKKDMNI